MMVKIEIPLASVEPLFTALHNIKPSNISRLEAKAVAVLKQALYFELENMMETPEEALVRKGDFQKLFAEQKKRREERMKRVEERAEL